MQTVVDTVRTAEGQEWEYAVPVPETLDEAAEVYGEDGTFNVFMAGLKVKLQNRARESFRSGKTREEVELEVSSYKPGAPIRASIKDRALNLITGKASEIEADADLKNKVAQAFRKGKFKDVVSLLEGEETE